jgi:glutathione S-transferase
VTPQLWSLPYSPWSEKAKWALDDSGVQYTRRRYEPLLGEPALRWRTGRWRGRVTVPVLQTDDGFITDSFEIARWAAAQAPGSTLVPEAELAKLREYNELSERGLAAGRAPALTRLLGHEAGLRDMVPKGVRKLGAVATKLASFGVRRTLRKYASTVDGEAERELVGVLERLRSDLAASTARSNGVAHLLPTFSYADIAMAQVLAFVEPPRTHLRLTDATRESFRDAELATRYADLLEWRDALYREHRDRKQD